MVPDGPELTGEYFVVVIASDYAVGSTCAVEDVG